MPGAEGYRSPASGLHSVSRPPHCLRQFSCSRDWLSLGGQRGVLVPSAPFSVERVLPEDDAARYEPLTAGL
jgi:hypothetical protein